MFKNFKGRYGERKDKKSDRDVMSYEDMPLDDYELEKTEMSPTAVKKIIISICIVLAAGLIVFAFANREKLSPENISYWWTYEVLGNAGNGYPVDLVGTDVETNNFAVNDGYVAYASDTSFVTLNSTGNEIANFQLRYSKPVMKNSKNMYITYGLGGTGFQIDNLDKQIYSGNAEAEIYTADISSNGVYAIVTEGNGYLSTLWVYNEDNNRIYKYSFSEYYITSIALNSNGTGCVATGISSDNGALVSAVYVLDFTKEEPYALYKIPDDAILSCKYLNDNRIALVGQSASYIVKRGDDSYVTNLYDDMTISNYYFNADTQLYTVALSRSGDGRSCTLISYNSNGEEQSRIDTENKADSLCTYKNRIAVLDGNIAYVYNTDGEKLYEAETGAGSKQIILNSASSAYLLSVNQVRYIDFLNPATADTAV